MTKFLNSKMKLKTAEAIAIIAIFVISFAIIDSIFCLGTKFI